MSSNWKQLTIGNEINLIGGFPFSSSNFNEDGIGKPLIRIRDLLNSTQETFYSGQFSESFLINEGDILVGMDGDFHIVRWRNTPSLLNQRILKVSGKKNSEIDIDFLFYFLQPFLIEVHNKKAATTVKHLSTYDISDAVDFFPSLPEQRKIAKFLSTCDEVIEKTEISITKYQAIKQGMMDDLFTRGIDIKTGKLRPKQEEAPELYEESGVGWIPKEWELKRLGDEINLIGGFPFSSSNFNEDGIGKPLIRIRDLLNSTQETFYSGQFSESFLINEGDILVGMDGDFHIVRWRNTPSLLNQRILKVSGKKNSEIDIDFLFYFLQPFLIEVHNKKAATTVKHLSTYDISDAVDFFPSLPEQRKIAKIISTCDEVIEKTEAVKAKYIAIKQGMMQDLLSGNKMVTV